MIEWRAFHKPSSKKKPVIGVLTSGGDAPGMNAAIRAVVRFGLNEGCKIYGIQRGYAGLLEGAINPLSVSSVANIIQRGGTILKTSRCPEFHKKSTRKEAAKILSGHGIDRLVVIGGDGSFAGAGLFGRENDFGVIGVPGTIDNDIAGTEDTIGFDTAVNTAVEAIDRIRDTASSHDRIFVVEVMGRSSGLIALTTGLGGGAETIVLPQANREVESVVGFIERGAKRGKMSSIVVVAEGVTGGAQALAAQLTRRGYDPKVCILGHTQRGGSPTAHDRALASALGASAVSALLAGKTQVMVGVNANRIRLVPFSKVLGRKGPPGTGLLTLAQALAS